MKKQRNSTSKTLNHFHMTEFKLKSSEPLKDRPLRKLNTTHGLFRNHHSQLDSNPHFRCYSKQLKPPIQQLTFLNHNHQQTFRLPQSCSKRLMSKPLDHNSHAAQHKLDDFLQDMHLTTFTKDRLNSKQTTTANFMHSTFLKTPTVRTEMRDKLQKSALQKFKQAVQKQNEQNQNVVSEKHAQALYQILTTARINKELGYRRANRQKRKQNHTTSVNQPTPIATLQLQSNQMLQDLNQQHQQKQSSLNKQPNDDADSQDPAQNQSTNNNYKLSSQSTKVPIQNLPKKQLQEFAENFDSSSSQNKSTQIQKTTNHKPAQQKFPRPITDNHIQQIQLIKKQQSMEQPKKITKKQSLQAQQRRQDSAQASTKVQKVTISVHSKEQQTVTPKQSIGPPPTLKLPQHTPLNNKTNNYVQDDQIEQVCLLKQPEKITKPPLSNYAQADSKQKEATKPSQQLKHSQISNVAQLSNNLNRAEAVQTSMDDSEYSPLEQLIYYMQRIEDIGQYRLNSKDIYSDKSTDKQLIQIYKTCSYYMAHHFLYLIQTVYNTLRSPPFAAPFYNLSAEELTLLHDSGDLTVELQNIAINIQESKKLLKKSYDQCKPYLQKEQQILLLDGKTNFHRKCCGTLIKQFRKIHELFQQSPKNKVLIKRCWYLIELYCSLKLLNHEEIKEYEPFEEIQDPLLHINTHKIHLIGK